MGVGRIIVIVILVLATEIVLLGGGVAWYVFSGRWTVAASEPHLRPVRWAADRVYRASVRRHAEAIPAEVIASADVPAGAQIYVENCASCHASGRPGPRPCARTRHICPEMALALMHRRWPGSSAMASR